MNVIAFLKRVKHYFIARDVRQQTQLELRIIGGHQFIARLGNEGAADAAAQFRADRNILQIRVA